MPIIFRPYYVVALTILSIATLANTQPLSYAARLDSCIHYYESGEYLKAVDSLTPLFPFLGPIQQEKAYKYLALSYAMLQMTSRAQQIYAAALDHYPNLRIDSLEVPPRIWTVFEETRLAGENETGRRQERMRKKIQISMASLILATSAAGFWTAGYIIGSDNNATARSASIATATASAITGGISFAILVRSVRYSRRLVRRL